MKIYFSGPESRRPVGIEYILIQKYFIRDPTNENTFQGPPPRHEEERGVPDMRGEEEIV